MTKWHMSSIGLAGAVFALLLPSWSMAADGTPPFIYVVVAEEAEVEKQGDDYAISVESDDIDHALEIGEKPFKLVNFISADRIVPTWKQGAGNFGAGVTMKGTILSEDGAIPGINIKSISKTADEMIFVFALDSGVSIDAGLLGELDDVTIVNYCCHPDGGDGQWLWGQ